MKKEYKKNSLILLTNFFPYRRGEEYLESEIIYLCHKFKQVIIVPTMIGPDESPTRKTPQNCEIINPGIELSAKRKIYFAVKPVNLSYEKNKGITNVYQKMYCKYFENRSQFVFDNLIKKLNLSELLLFGNIVIYSYWLYVTANVAIKVKNYFFEQYQIKIPVVSRGHRYDIYEEESRLNYLPQREFLLNNLNKFFPCSKDGKASIVSKHPNYAEKMQVNYLGCKKGKFNLGSDRTTIQIVSCSSITSVKRVDRIVYALHELEKQGIKYYWTHFGDGKGKKKLTALASKLLSTENYKLVGFISNSELMRWYDANEVDLFINVSTSEGIPVSIMEVISRGIPCIVTDVGGNKEIIIHGENGFVLHKEFTTNQLSKQIQVMKEYDDIQYEKFKDSSLEHWRSRFNSVTNYSKFTEELFQLAEGEV